MKTELSLYIHIPFCIRKCRYCDFLSFEASNDTRKSYIDSLLQEIVYRGKDYQNRKVISIYIGGGTPSCLDDGMIGSVLNTVRQIFFIEQNAEISIEVNPGTVDEKKLIEYRQAGINRLSIGLQSTLDSELECLGRIHTYEQFLNTYNLARKCGFENVNVDLISALPNQSIDDYRLNLDRIAKLHPEHISAYSLQLEENTYFWNHQGEYDWPDEDLDRELYYLTEDVLAKYGYHRYEISNYALNGFECEHNKVYWNRGNYLGLGLGASSLIDNVRFKNTDYIEKYREYIYEDVQKLSVEEQIEEFMFLGLRLTSGVSKQKFEECFKRNIDDIYLPEINKLKSEELIEEDKNCIRLTPKGMDVSNYVFEKFML